MANLPGHVWVDIMFCINDPVEMRAYRATSARVFHAGENARLVLEAKVDRMNGYPSIWPDLIRRLLFWTPWVGRLYIVEPPAPTADFTQLYLWKRPKGETGWDQGHRWVSVHGCSTRSIFFKAWVEGRGWVFKAELYYRG